jgi:hypothetical protein
MSFLIAGIARDLISEGERVLSIDGKKLRRQLNDMNVTSQPSSDTMKVWIGAVALRGRGRAYATFACFSQNSRV